MTVANIPISTDNDDGSCRRTSSTSWATVSGGGGTFEDVSAASNYISKAFYSPTWYSAEIVLRFDTSALPDNCTITAATLKLYVESKLDGSDNLNYAADFYDFGGEPCVAGDWEVSSSGDAIASIDATNLTAGAVNNIPLTGLTGISKTGMTGLRITAATSAAPVDDNNVLISSYEHATNPPPELEITYTTVVLDTCIPDADVTTTGWTTTPLWNKVNDASDATVIQATAV